MNEYPTSKPANKFEFRISSGDTSNWSAKSQRAVVKLCSACTAPAVG